MFRTFRVAALAAMLVAAPAAHSEPAPAGAAGEALSFDGLRKIDSKRFALVWVREGASFSGYKKLGVLPAEISYKSPPKRGPTADDNFALSDAQTKRLRKALKDEFTEELVTKGGWQVSDVTGPDVLLVRGALIDMVVHVPPQKAGRSTVLLDSFGEATLVIEFYDSQTRQILARIADREAAEPPGNRMGTDMEAAGEVRRMFSAWAKRLREGLEEARVRMP